MSTVLHHITVKNFISSAAEVTELIIITVMETDMK
jgi:hypothetical protein